MATTHLLDLLIICSLCQTLIYCSWLYIGFGPKLHYPLRVRAHTCRAPIYSYKNLALQGVLTLPLPIASDHLTRLSCQPFFGCVNLCHGYFVTSLHNKLLFRSAYILAQHSYLVIDAAVLLFSCFLPEMQPYCLHYGISDIVLVYTIAAYCGASYSHLHKLYS